jgi:acetyltransferase-like isoleucine patch superfamily enzyme
MKPVEKNIGIVNVSFGEYVHIVQPVNLYGCTIGNNCFIGPFTEIQSDVFIGENCRIQSHSFICTGVQIGENCFIAQMHQPGEKPRLVIGYRLGRMQR